MSIDVRKPELIQQEIRDLEKSGQSSREWLAQHPDDVLINLLVEQDKVRKHTLLDEWKCSCTYYRKHWVLYAIKTQCAVEIEQLGHLLGAFKGVLTAACSFVSKKDAHMPLYFDTVVQSSFGVMMSTQYDEELIYSQKERTLSLFFSITENLLSSNLSKDDIDNLFSNDKALLRKFRTFFRSVVHSTDPIQVKWGGLIDGHVRETSITKESSIRIYKYLLDADQPVDELVSVTGSIQGVSLIDRTIQFVPHQQKGSRVKLVFSDSFTEVMKHLLGEVVNIKYNIITKYDDSSDKMVTEKMVLSVTRNDGILVFNETPIS